MVLLNLNVKKRKNQKNTLLKVIMSHSHKLKVIMSHSHKIQVMALKV